MTGNTRSCSTSTDVLLVFGVLIDDDNDDEDNDDDNDDDDEVLDG